MVTYAVVGGDHVKVGRTNNISKRMLQLATGAPFKLTLIGTVDGDVEGELLRELRKIGAHAHGEWFVDNDKVRRTLRFYGFEGA